MVPVSPKLQGLDRSFVHGSNDFDLFIILVAGHSAGIHFAPEHQPLTEFGPGEAEEALNRLAFVSSGCAES